MSPHQMPRREFLAMRASSVPAVGFDWSAWPTATVRRDGATDYDAIVIGSGLGGLACAAAFARQGFSPLVGAIDGWDQTVGNSGGSRVGHGTPVPNLYLCGAWPRPGHGYGAVVPRGVECFAEIAKAGEG
jgi:hypothetical protein